MSAVDPDGRRVVLDEDGWRHILDGHPEMAAYLAALIATIERPDHREPDPRPQRERYWRLRLGPSRWLFVVVDSAVHPARVVTAQGRRDDPEGW